MTIAEPVCLQITHPDATSKESRVTSSTPPAPYLHFPGTAREALTFYAHVFGGSVQLHTLEDFNRTAGPAEPGSTDEIPEFAAI
jgi:hypothetical protein